MKTDGYVDIPGYEWLYRINRSGDVERFGKILRYHKSRNGYCILMLSKKWERKVNSIHRLLAQTFIPNPENKRTVNHKNWIRDDNRLENLEWMSDSENVKDWYLRWRIWSKSNLWNFWSKNPYHKNIAQYTKDWKFIRRFDSVSDAARYLLCSPGSISNNLIWRSKSCYGFIWKYI